MLRLYATSHFFHLCFGYTEGDRMRYVGLDLHTKDIVYSVHSEIREILFKGKIKNNMDELSDFLSNFEKGDSFIVLFIFPFIKSSPFSDNTV